MAGMGQTRSAERLLPAESAGLENRGISGLRSYISDETGREHERAAGKKYMSRCFGHRFLLQKSGLLDCGIGSTS